jgi:hypothetical protein
MSYNITGIKYIAEDGKVRPWTVDSVARISEMAEAYAGQEEAE